MKLVTWNVNSITARLARAEEFLEREQPDILCLQELKCAEERFPFEAMKALGYESAVHGQKTYNGVAILVRQKSKCGVAKNIEKGFSDGDADVAARCISAQFGELWVVNAYVPNGQEVGSEKYLYKLKWLDRFANYLKAGMKKHSHVVVVGDFNVAPGDRDVHDPDLWSGSVLCVDGVREKLQKIQSLGLRDLYREKKPEGNDFSWWDYRNLSFPKNNGLRIDLILGTSNLLELASDVRFDRNERKGEKPSDHIPVILELAKLP